MYVVHAAGDRDRVLASSAERADSALEKLRGLVGRRELPDEYALVFDLGEPAGWLPDAVAGLTDVHMLGVRCPIDVVWVRDERVTKVATLRPWVGFGVGRADTLVELPAGAADGVDVGDRLWVTHRAPSDGPD